jgi:hypothetical protein
VRAGLGAASRAQVMTAVDPVAAYRLRGLGVAAAVGIDAVFGRRAVIAVDGAYGYGYAPGADVRSPDGAAMATVSLSMHEVDLGVGGGARAGAGLFTARLGYHYEAALVDDLNNAAHLPSEHLHGPVLGARAELAARRLWLRVGADLMVAGQRAQTTGLEDGTPQRVSALFGQAAAGCTVHGLRVETGYRLTQQRTEWSGPSVRQPGGGGASRSDRSHTVTVGISRRF